MNLEKVIFGFFVLLAATLNFGFFIGDIANPELHNIYELFAALAVSLIATVLKFGDRTQIGAVHLATSLVADLQLVAASVVWVWAVEISADGMTAAPYRQRGLPVRRGAAGQPGLGRAAGDRDRHLPPRMMLGRHEQPAAGLLVSAVQPPRGAEPGPVPGPHRVLDSGIGRPSSWSCGGCGPR